MCLKKVLLSPGITRKPQMLPKETHDKVNAHFSEGAAICLIHARYWLQFLIWTDC